MTASSLKDDLTGRAMGGCPKRLVDPRKSACGGACLAFIFAAKFCLATHGKGDHRILLRSAPLGLILPPVLAAGATFSIVRTQLFSIPTTPSSEQ
jgi:hypothetical protein